MSDLNVDGMESLPENKGKVTLTSRHNGKEYGGKIVNTKETFCKLASETVFADITLKSSANITFVCNFNPVVFDDGFKTELSDKKNVRIVGGFYSPTSEQLAITNLDTNITINNGEFYLVIGLSKKKGMGIMYHTGTSNITVNGGKVDILNAGTHENHAGMDVVVNINGGEVNKLRCAGDVSRRLYGDATVNLIGGKVSTLEVNNVLKNTYLNVVGCAPEKVSVSYYNNEIKETAQKNKATTHVSYNSLVCSDAATDKIGAYITLGGAVVDKVTLSEKNAEYGYGAISVSGGKIKKMNTAESKLADIKDKFGETKNGNIIYLADGGTGNGISPEAPMGDLNAAIKALGGEGSIVVAGTYTIKERMVIESHAYPVVITSIGADRDYRNTGAAIVFEKTLLLGGDTTFEKINLSTGVTNLYIYGMSHKLVIGEEVNTTLTAEGITYLSIVGVRDDKILAESVDVTIKSGDWGIFRAGSNETGAYNNDLKINVTIDGGVFHKYVALGARGQITGTINCTINNGRFYQGVYLVYKEDGKHHKLNYDATLTINGGEFYQMVAPAKSRSTTVNGKYNLYINGGDFSSCTDVAGSELYAGYMSSYIHIGEGVDVNKKETGDKTFKNPLDPNAPDPWLFYHDGYYYYTHTTGKKIILTKATNVGDITTSAETNKPEKIVFPDFPELDTIGTNGGYSKLVVNGKTYMTFIRSVNRGTPEYHQKLCIAEIDTPWSYKGVPLTLTVSEYDWECHGYGQNQATGGWYPKVIEGASAVYGDNGEVYIMYTGSGYWTKYYALGFLRYMGGDPLDAASWKKNPEPVLSLNDEVNGCGHGSYYKDHNGDYYVAYHGYVGKDTEADTTQTDTQSGTTVSPAIAIVIIVIAVTVVAGGVVLYVVKGNKKAPEKKNEEE